MGEINISEQKRKKVDEIKYSIAMYMQTLADMSHRGVSKSRVDEVNEELQNQYKLLEFISGLDDEDFCIYYNFPIDVIHKVFPFADTEHEIETYERLFQIYNGKEKERVKTSLINSAISSKIGEPLRKNNYLVFVPEYFEIAPNEVVGFHYNYEEKGLSLTVRETSGKNQIKNIINYLNSENNDNPVPYENIIVKQLKPNLEVEYTHVFGGAVLKRFYEEPLTYKVKEGEDNCKYFTMVFEYQKQYIDETTD